MNSQEWIDKFNNADNDPNSLWICDYGCLIEHIEHGIKIVEKLQEENQKLKEDICKINAN